MAKQRTNQPSKTDPDPSTAGAPQKSVEIHRVLISDTADPLNPRVAVICVPAELWESATEEVSKLSHPFSGALPAGMFRTTCRLEEVLPFARKGFGIRRATWPITEVALIHPSVRIRLDIYQRNPNQPHYAPQHLREIRDFAGADILSEDWSVDSRPPVFGNRRE